MLIFQLFVSKINSNSLFRTHVVRLYDLMSYNYTLPSRTTIGCHVVRHENLLTLLFNLKNHNSLIFSTFFSSFIFSIFTQNKNICSEIPKSQRGKYKEKITNTHGSIYIVRSCSSSKGRLCICFLKIGFTFLEDLTHS